MSDRLSKLILTSLVLLIVPIPAKSQPDDVILAADAFDGDVLNGRDSGSGWLAPWKTSRVASATMAKLRLVRPGIHLSNGRAVEIPGTGERNNPLRRPLAKPVTDEQIFVRFLLRYDADSIDQQGEFFVLWLDAVEGSDSSTHSARVPNIGIHVNEQGRNAFMIRTDSANEVFTDVEVIGDQTYLLVARLAKSVPGADRPFDIVELWVDPEPDDQHKPSARLEHAPSIPAIRWLGFATGRKTEPDDRIWIDELALGTTWEAVLGLPPIPVPVEIIEEEPIPETDHWAFLPVRRPDIPWTPGVHSPIDAFITATLREHGISPTPEAPRQTLIRRLSFDLIGLPPDPIDVERFASTPEPDAYEHLVDRLLASPQHGERWGRHWLDLARFAESNGHQHNRERPHAWRYRDYVIESLNADKPYDRFLTEQIAGDELLPYTDENLIATGFLAAARYSGNELDKALQRNDILVDVANMTASSVLGLTMECAQCHEHKFDPISARDYYRFQGFFLKGQPVNVVLGDADTSARSAWIREREQLFETVRARLIEAERKRRRPGEQILIIPKNVVKGMSPAERSRYDELGAKIDRLSQAWAFYSPVTSPTRLDVPPLELRWPLPFSRDRLAKLEPRQLVRGDVESPGERVNVGWPAVFGRVPEDAPIQDRPRTVLAEWLTHPENPLTSRIWANRVWHHHLGQGFVPDPSNLGTQTPAPSHPELLDWLASELVNNGWSTKSLHRSIVLSAVYRRATLRAGNQNERDAPDDRYFSRWVPRRLEAEAIRDTALAISGRLDPRFGGPSVPVAERDRSLRRSLYLFQKRADLPAMQDLFDGPSALASCGIRRVSTVGLQPLFLLNDPFMTTLAHSFARRVEDLAGSEPDLQITTAIRLALGREPDPEERRRCQDFLVEDGSLDDLCLALLNLNESLYIP